MINTYHSCREGDKQRETERTRWGGGGGGEGEGRESDWDIACWTMLWKLTHQKRRKHGHFANGWRERERERSILLVLCGVLMCCESLMT